MPTSRVAVIGAGVSALVHDLVRRGYVSIDAVDVSAAALDQLRVSLGAHSDSVRYLQADVREVHFDGPIDVWHDRATFHFLVDPADQERYVQRVQEAVAPGGHLVLATFAEDGPLQCSGLPVVRHSVKDLQDRFGEQFTLIEYHRRDHLTPSGAAQSFTHALFTRRE